MFWGKIWQFNITTHLVEFQVGKYLFNLLGVTSEIEPALLSILGLLFLCYASLVFLSLKVQCDLFILWHFDDYCVQSRLFSMPSLCSYFVLSSFLCKGQLLYFFISYSSMHLAACVCFLNLVFISIFLITPLPSLLLSFYVFQQQLHAHAHE